MAQDVDTPFNRAMGLATALADQLNLDLAVNISTDPGYTPIDTIYYIGGKSGLVGVEAPEAFSNIEAGSPADQADVIVYYSAGRFNATAYQPDLMWVSCMGSKRGSESQSQTLGIHPIEYWLVDPEDIPSDPSIGEQDMTMDVDEYGWMSCKVEWDEDGKPLLNFVELDSSEAIINIYGYYFKDEAYLPDSEAIFGKGGFYSRFFPPFVSSCSYTISNINVKIHRGDDGEFADFHELSDVDSCGLFDEPNVLPSSIGVGKFDMVIPTKEIIFKSSMSILKDIEEENEPKFHYWGCSSEGIEDWRQDCAGDDGNVIHGYRPSMILNDQFIEIFYGLEPGDWNGYGMHGSSSVMMGGLQNAFRLDQFTEEELDRPMSIFVYIKYDRMSATTVNNNNWDPSIGELLEGYDTVMAVGMAYCGLGTWRETNAGTVYYEYSVNGEIWTGPPPVEKSCGQADDGGTMSYYVDDDYSTKGAGHGPFIMMCKSGICRDIIKGIDLQFGTSSTDESMSNYLPISIDSEMKIHMPVFMLTGAVNAITNTEDEIKQFGQVFGQGFVI